MQVKEGHAAGGHRPESGQGFRGHFSGLAGARQTRASGPWIPLAIAQVGESQVARRVPTLCSVGRYASCFGVRCAVGQHPPVATRAGWPLGRASAGGCEAARGIRVVRCGRRGAARGGGGGGGGGWRRRRRRAAQVRREAHSRFALISAVEPHTYRPSLHRNLKQEKAGTIVTFLATPYFRPPTVEATWVPCPLHPMPSAGRMPLTAWHEAHSGCANACNGEGRMRGSTVSGCRVVWGMLGRVV